MFEWHEKFAEIDFLIAHFGEVKIFLPSNQM
jgi:hypothetical protein